MHKERSVMQSCADWLKNNIDNAPSISDSDFNAAGEKPSEDEYVHSGRVNSIVIHHSATISGCARVFRALHRAVNGWIDIGYHFVIGNGTLSGDGEVEEGRPIWAVGAHSRGHNKDSIGICLVGNFNLEAPTGKQLESLASLLERLMIDLSLPESCITLHRDVQGCLTECPGKNLTIVAILNSLGKRI
jgi:N-acetylmuramoyl-L-alanine amidase